jgi:hypothetical protein
MSPRCQWQYEKANILTPSQETIMVFNQEHKGKGWRKKARGLKSRESFNPPEAR